MSQNSVSSVTSENITSIIASLTAAIKNYQKLNKSKNKSYGKKNFEDFMEHEFSLPTKKVITTKTSEIPTGTLVKDEINKFKKVSEDLAKELSCEKQKYAELEKSVESKYTIKLLKEKDKKCQALGRNLSEISKELKRVRSRESYHREKISKMESAEGKQEYESKKCSLESHKEIIKTNEKLKSDNNYLLSSCEWMEEFVREGIAKEESLKLFDEDSKKFSNDCELCVFGLLNQNVSVNKVGPVIKTVLQLVDKTPNRLPSKSTVIDMNIRRLALAQHQIGEVFSQEESTCLLTDETSRRGSKYMGYEAGDSEGNLWVLGLRDIKTKSAADTLAVFKEILSDIDTVFKSTSNEKSKLIMQHIVATMSDRASTEVKFNELLQDYKRSIMPLIIENFNDIADEEKETLSKLVNFFCGLYALIHMAKTAQKALLQAEAGLFDDGIVPNPDPQFQNMQEPGTVRLIRTASKAFAPGADEKSGCYGHFVVFVRDFLKENRLHSLPLAQFRGARFNILFSNAASVYFLHKQMLKYLQQCGAENRLVKSVLKDLGVPEFVAGCKALGLLSYLVTGPLWSIIESKTINIMDMNERYEQLLIFCENVLENLPQFLAGEFLPFNEDTRVKRDCIYDCLMQESEHDNTVQVMLAVIFPGFALLCKHLFKDHLPGGIHSDLDVNDPTLRNKLKCVPKSSKYAESVFGLLDFVLKQKPNISTLASEAYIMFSQNKTLSWITEKSAEEKADLLKNARKNSKTLRNQFKLRKQEIFEACREIIQTKIRQKEAAKIKKSQQFEGYTTSMIDYGLWQTTEQVDNNLKLLVKVSEKYAGLKAQVQFRQHVLKQLAAKETFALTKLLNNKRVKLTVPEMTENVKKLISSIPQNTTEAINILIGRRVRHRFRNPEQEDSWYIGTVISQVPGYPTWYNIKYEQDPSIYTYELQDDLDTGDLEIVV